MTRTRAEPLLLAESAGVYHLRIDERRNRQRI
jgi:hypothetical protein